MNPSAALAAVNRTPTHFAMSASGYATQVVGGKAPAGSDRSAFQVLGCTNLAGLNQSNGEASTTVPGLGVVNGALTRVWTTTKNGTVTAVARHSIDSVVVSKPGTGRLVLHNLVSTSRVLHRGDGFHAKTASSVGAIVFTPTGGVARKLKAPLPGQTLTIPGLASLTPGPTHRKHGANGAAARADVMDITVVASGTETLLAHSRAMIHNGIASGVFRGSSYASQSQAADGHVVNGKNPYVVMPCQGTNGQLVTKSIVRTALTDGSIARGLSSTQEADQTANRATGFERSRVNTGIFDGGKLVVRGVVGRANVAFIPGQGTHGNIKGSRVGSVTYNGQQRRFPSSGALIIPGVASLHRNVVTRTTHGIAVTGLRVKLLDGSGAVINLGHAQCGIRSSGL